jgi:hypothetical protein
LEYAANDLPIVLDEWPSRFGETRQPTFADLLRHQTFACTEAVVQQLLSAKPSLAVMFVEFAAQVLETPKKGDGGGGDGGAITWCGGMYFVSPCG